ncbi:MAG: ATPase [Chloroflexota bacterium]|nr:ATPase [Chloroflexota bacterium]
MVGRYKDWTQDNRLEGGGVATVDIQFLIDRLDGMMQQSRRSFIGGKVQVDENEMQQIIDQMRASVPNEIKQARRVLQERENIIKSAQDEAEQIVTFAKQQAEYLTSEHGLLQEAKMRSEMVLREASDQKEMVLTDARRFALDAIISVDGVLEALDHAVVTNQRNVRRVLESLQEQPMPVAP